ncbi:ABC transporter permease [Intestinimonas butyriciproducens]|uniref:ABC transporter permease n=1 Tax=Intestinimonas butyriciproducens TaxID=1297617 RepID=UPI00195DC32D|nr:ABC transporter permease [Intestinimonas butyriciproducens]MBM6977478.1 ABC transporter permease [Intestinimonas butyriciproducens]
MAQYIRRRLITAIPVFFGITMLVFLLVDLAPGDLTDLMGEGAASTVEQAAMEAAVGLDQPLPVRYLLWLAGLFRGDLGRSYHYGQDVSDLIVQRIGPSLLLTGTGVVLAVAIAVPLGVAAAWKPKGAWDRLAHLFTISGSAVPGFFLALVAIYLFSVRLGWLPSSGMYRSVGGGDMADLLRHLILPAGVVGVSNVGSILRQTQSACLEVLGEDYIITARAKGLREGVVVVRHALGSALIPVLTSILTHVPHIIGGSVVVERIFGWPGMGSLMFSAVSGRDYNVVMGGTVVMALAVLLTSLLLDVVYGLVDPRVRYGER